MLVSRQLDSDLHCSLVRDNMLLVGSDDGIEVLDIKSLKLIERKLGHHGSVRSLAYSHLDQKIFSGGFDSKIFVWCVE